MKNLILVTLSLILIGCTSNPFQHRGLAPHEQWATDMMEGNHAEAQPLMVVDDFEHWRMSTNDLRLGHGGLKSIGQTNGLEDPVSSRYFQFTFNDGFQRCLRIKITERGQVTPLDPDYQESSPDAFPSPPQ